MKIKIQKNKTKQSKIKLFVIEKKYTQYNTKEKQTDQMSTHINICKNLF
jgi:cytochrome c